MPRTRPPYPAEFREQMMEMVRAGRTPEELAAEFEPSAETIRQWVKKAERGEGKVGRSDGAIVSEREELARLRREVKILRQEKEILKKAAAWFARESSSLPPNSTSS
ncbi:MAG: transposase [Gemmatimonas sp.]|nr:transposase [Gemmatimonas sp.]